MEALEKTDWRIGGPHGAAAMMGLRPSTFRLHMKTLGSSVLEEIIRVSLAKEKIVNTKAHKNVTPHIYVENIEFGNILHIS